MKKWITIFVCILLVFSMVSVFATADVTQVTATEEGYENVLFSNEYRGFCVDEGLNGAEISDIFTVHPASEIMNNKNGQNVSNELKLMMTKGFHSFFEKDANGTYGITEYGLQLAQRVAWYYTDNYVSANFKTDIERLVAQIDKWVADGISVADEGTVFAADDATNIQMDFSLLQTSKDGQQCFFGYKMTQTPIVPQETPTPAQPTTPTEPSTPVQPPEPNHPLENPDPSDGNGPQNPQPQPPSIEIEEQKVPTAAQPDQPIHIEKNPTPTPPSEQGDTQLPVTGDATHVALAALLGCAAFVGLALTKRK